MPHHSDGCVPRTVRSRSFKGGRQGVGPVACGDAWHIPGRIDSSMATAKTYQSPPMCLRKCACQYVLASVVQHRHVAVFEGEVAAVVLFDGDVLQTASDQKPAATCVVTSHGDARLAAVDISSHQSARASWLTWLVRPDPCHPREPRAYMHHDSCLVVVLMSRRLSR